LLGAVKVEKSQGNNAAVILNTAHQAAATTKDHVTGANLALDHHFGHRLSTAYGGDLGTIYIAQGQMKQQILQAVESELF
jgi:hypothetical protein